MIDYSLKKENFGLFSRTQFFSHASIILSINRLKL